MKLYKLYYYCRVFIPRWLQILARRRLARTKRVFHRARWPIDPDALGKPEGFTGWPEDKGFALVLRHDVESDAGTRRCGDLLQIEHSFGMRSAFFLVPEDYVVARSLRTMITTAGSEVGVHGLRHDGRLYESRKAFRAQAAKINQYLEDWGAVGFASPSAHHRFDWLHELNILYDTSSFDTDPFEPQPDGVQTIFPMVVGGRSGARSFVELPYTLPQDFTLFVILQEDSTRVWRRKLDWVAANGGMVMVNTHPDYMRFRGKPHGRFSYPADFYEELLLYIERTHRGSYWMALPREVAAFWRTLPGGPDPSRPAEVVRGREHN